MSKSSARGLFGRRTTGTVTVLETKVHRATDKHAKLAYILTALVVGTLSMAVLASVTHPILAFFGGALLGVAVGAVAWALVKVWPAIRLVWWWLPEILLGAGVVYGFAVLAQATSLPVRIAVLAVLVGVPAGVLALRRRIVAWAWCLIVRHRLRTSFAQFIITNSSGTLPLICFARPTQVGERVWIWLRPGLSRADIEARMDKLAAACWAAQVVVQPAAATNSAFLRIDVKRREVLNTTIASPLVDNLDPGTPTTTRPAPQVPTALDLPDVADVHVSLLKPSAKQAKTTTTTSANGTPVKGDDQADDVNDWI